MTSPRARQKPRKPNPAPSAEPFICAGSSGFSYDAWKGSFYPLDQSPKKMLAAYAARLPTVELNATFYRLPTEQTVRGWQSQVPETFRFAVKAPQRISHQLRLRGCAEHVTLLQAVIAPLGAQLSSVLVQLPPNMKRDDERLAEFLAVWGQKVPLAMEFRHPSWFEPAVLDALRNTGAALCIGDPEKETYIAPLEVTAGFTFVRLRAPKYEDDQLRDWVGRLRGLGVNAFVYFKHETTAPEYAARLNELSRS
jgi:uncharacterized protein YecE (DUF72 family)